MSLVRLVPELDKYSIPQQITIPSPVLKDYSTLEERACYLALAEAALSKFSCLFINFY